MPLAVGAPVTPEDLANQAFDSVTLNPVVAAGASSQVVFFNNSYGIWVDNVDNGGGAGSRLWIDMPNLADVVIGPRSGTSIGAGFRFRTNKTTASAANVFINSTTYEIARSTSSRKYKADIEPHEIDLDALRRLRVVTFHDRGQLAELGPDKARRYVGVIAEEVDELGLSEFVAYDDATGEPDSMMYDRLVLGALQLIAALEQRVDELTAAAARVDELETRLARLEAAG